MAKKKDQVDNVNVSSATDSLTEEELSQVVAEPITPIDLFRTTLTVNLHAAEGRFERLGQVYDWIMEKIKVALEAVELQLPPKEDILVIVSDLYDKFVEPIDLPGPDSLLDPLLKNLVLKTTSRMYDQLVNKHLPDNGVPTL